MKLALTALGVTGGVVGITHYIWLLLTHYGPAYLVREEERLLDLTRPEDKALLAAGLAWAKVRWPELGPAAKDFVLRWVPPAQKADAGAFIDALEAAQEQEDQKLEGGAAAQK